MANSVARCGGNRPHSGHCMAQQIRYAGVSSPRVLAGRAAYSCKSSGRFTPHDCHCGCGCCLHGAGNSCRAACWA